MIFSIGLGSFITNFILIILIIISIVIFFVLLFKKNYLLAFLLISLFFNIISFLFFLGSASIFEYFNVIFWPIINLILIISYVYRKRKQ